ncbi:uncharacterized protein LOC118742517 isoform X2 [Rhagoletis pomonella]|uniref:uncharacterized protein LOC118742517 isoform X2 n=1 Tax=Rhagoletis pomonella TaxID=28610 RepID=UPI00177ABCDE|nr:uncharacterized protein LOC118742517 isoform X2 [Rhagoletis pomonella]
MSMYAKQNRKSIFNLIMVLTVLVQGAFGQSFLLSLGQNQRNFFAEGNSREAFLTAPLGAQLNYTDPVSNVHLESRDEFDENNNTTIIVIKSIREQSNELSQTAMDIITIVWYVATFLALAAFFLLMACSDRRCTENRGNVLDNETQIAPPTPSPSYSEFAPPSYETVIKMQHDARTSVFVIPFGPGSKDVSTNSNGSSLHTPQTTPTTPAINYYTVNELEKLGH